MRAIPSGDALVISCDSGVGTNCGNLNCICAANLETKHNKTQAVRDREGGFRSAGAPYLMPSGQVRMVGEPSTEHIL
jgi:hypothetical protein